MISTGISGLLAGLNVDRALIQHPAWEKLGAEAWARYSRNADLSRNAIVLYPLLGFGQMILATATAVAVHHHRKANVQAALASYAAAALAIGGLSLTLKAGPYMFSVRHARDAESLDKARVAFRYWGGLRGVLQISAFFASVWSLGSL